MKVIYLKPLGGYASDMRSDTLWGMLCWGIRHLWGEGRLKEFLENCQSETPPLVISSTFPYKYPYDLEKRAYSKERMLYFPNPLPFPDKHDDKKHEALETGKLRKAYKKAFSLVNFEDFGQILTGELTADQLCDRLRKIKEAEAELEDVAKRRGKRKEERAPTQAEINWTAPSLDDFSMTHNTIDRLRGGTLNLPGGDGEPAGQLFHSAENYWADRYANPDQDTNTGIFFLADGKEADMLEPIMHLYRHWGFGADRTTGKGFFEASFGTIDFPEPTAANAMLNLSLLRPTPDELKSLDDAAKIDDTCFHYNIEIRRGYVSARKEIRKQAHRYFAEGSVLPLVKKGHLGGLEEQKFIKEKAPSHPVYDNGLGLMLPLKWQ